MTKIGRNHHEDHSNDLAQDLNRPVLDEALANYTDQVWKGPWDEEQAAGEESVNATPKGDEELRALQATVLRVRQVLGPQKPNPEMTRRIWDKLSVEWSRAGLQRASQPAAQVRFSPKIKRWFEAWGHPHTRPARVLRYAAAVAMAVFILLLFLPDQQIGLPGAALGGANLLLVILTLICLGILAWLAWRKR